MNATVPAPRRAVPPASRLPGSRLHARVHSLAPAVLALCAVAFLCLWLAHALRPGDQAGFSDPFRTAPLLAFGPLLVGVVTTVSQHRHAPELEGTAVRSPLLLRLVPLLGLLVVGTALLVLAALAGPAEGRDLPALVRATVGATGLMAGTATLLGARAGWLPAAVYLPAVHLGHPGVPDGRAAQVWAWSTCPGDQLLPWVTGIVLLVGGTALHALLGARPEPA
ncbi:hypothetical protein AB0J21_25770 [Streptomyces sp. NPDC049954]|uniref:hypothetical protein n=1 Tax=Streptomyces sp. NPDC049954 TaxID=3155779 RepID=UPI00341FEA44